MAYDCIGTDTRLFTNARHPVCRLEIGETGLMLDDPMALLSNQHRCRFIVTAVLFDGYRGNVWSSLRPLFYNMGRLPVAAILVPDGNPSASIWVARVYHEREWARGSLIPQPGPDRVSKSHRSHRLTSSVALNPRLRRWGSAPITSHPLVELWECLYAKPSTTKNVTHHSVDIRLPFHCFKQMFYSPGT